MRTCVDDMWPDGQVSLCLFHSGEGSVAKQGAASPSRRSREMCRNVSFLWVMAKRAGEKQCVTHHGDFPGGWRVDVVR